MLGIAMWGIRIPFADLLQPALGIDAIWWSFPVSALCSMLMSLAYYRWGNWRQARMLKPDPEAVALPSEVPAQVPSPRSEEHTSELQSLMRISYAVFCLQKKNY